MRKSWPLHLIQDILKAQTDSDRSVLSLSLIVGISRSKIEELQKIKTEDPKSSPDIIRISDEEIVRHIELCDLVIDFIEPTSLMWGLQHVACALKAKIPAETLIGLILASPFICLTPEILTVLEVGLDFAKNNSEKLEHMTALIKTRISQLKIREWIISVEKANCRQFCFLNHSTANGGYSIASNKRLHIYDSYLSLYHEYFKSN
ncbi:hypothetical protein ACOME3_006969 [Neoechinorhynchus agilis]